jgi:hypothetical protein
MPFATSTPMNPLQGDTLSADALPARVRWHRPPEPGLAEQVRRWIDGSETERGTPLKSGRVYRRGDWVAKYYGAPRPLERLFRSPPAFRAAARALSMPSGAAPAPLAAVVAAGRRGRVDLYVSRFVEGLPLHLAWCSDARVVAALGEFLARLHRARVHHGDLHPGNLLWTGAGLVLLDLDALRRGLHLAGAERLARNEWANLLVHLGDDAGLSRAHRAYCETLGRPARAEAEWNRIVALAGARGARRATVPAVWRGAGGDVSGGGATRPPKP